MMAFCLASRSAASRSFHEYVRLSSEEHAIKLQIHDAIIALQDQKPETNEQFTKLLLNIAHTPLEKLIKIILNDESIYQLCQHPELELFWAYIWVNGTADIVQIPGGNLNVSLVRDCYRNNYDSNYYLQTKKTTVSPLDLVLGHHLYQKGLLRTGDFSETTAMSFYLQAAKYHSALAQLKINHMIFGKIRAQQSLTTIEFQLITNAHVNATWIAQYQNPLIGSMMLAEIFYFRSLANCISQTDKTTNLNMSLQALTLTQTIYAKLPTDDYYRNNFQTFNYFHFNKPQDAITELTSQYAQQPKTPTQVFKNSGF